MPRCIAVGAQKHVSSAKTILGRVVIREPELPTLLMGEESARLRSFCDSRLCTLPFPAGGFLVSS
jgi:hypothetical protein